jgi:hypothetical protein
MLQNIYIYLYIYIYIYLYMCVFACVCVCVRVNLNDCVASILIEDKILCVGKKQLTNLSPLSLV